MITWESIITKLGFDPREGRKITITGNEHEDDSEPSVYAVLSDSELDWLCEQLSI